MSGFCQMTVSKLLPELRKLDPESHYFTIGSLLSLTDALKIMLKVASNFLSTYRYSEMMPGLEVDGLRLGSFDKLFKNRLIRFTLPIDAMTTRYATRYLRSSASIRKVLFPHEEKTVERAILMELDEGKSNTVSVGFAHAVHNRGLVYFRNHAFVGANPPRPRQIATTGPDARDFLVRQYDVPVENLPVIGSPRYVEPVARTFDSKRFVFLMGDQTEIITLARYLREYFPFFAGLSMAIKPHPYAYQRMQKKAMRDIIRNLPETKVFNGSLEEALDWANVAVFDSTSTGVEAILSGAVGVWANLDPVIGRSAIEGRPLADCTQHCRNASELKAVIGRLASMESSDLEDLAKNAASSSKRHPETV